MTRKPAMPAETLRALKASIEKWRKNESGDYQGLGTNTCALCVLFYGDKHSGHCIGCPVAEKSGNIGCVGTPYEGACDATVSHGYTSKQFRAAAKLERIFLESLLPKEARK